MSRKFLSMRATGGAKWHQASVTPELKLEKVLFKRKMSFSNVIFHVTVRYSREWTSYSQYSE